MWMPVFIIEAENDLKEKARERVRDRESAKENNATHLEPREYINKMFVILLFFFLLFNKL